MAAPSSSARSAERSKAGERRQNARHFLFFWRPLDRRQRSEQVSVARLRENPTDDLAFHTEQTGSYRQVPRPAPEPLPISPTFSLAYCRFCALVGEGALSISCFNEASLSSAMPPKAGSRLHWGRMSLRDDKTKKVREDAVLYVPDASGPAVTVAVAEGADANFVWAFTQKTIEDLKADPVITNARARVCAVSAKQLTAQVRYMRRTAMHCRRTSSSAAVRRCSCTSTARRRSRRTFSSKSTT